RGELRTRPRLRPGRRGAPGRPAVPAAGQVGVLLDHRRQAGRVLDHLAVHVDDVKGAAGRVGELAGAEPDVARCDKLLPLVRALGHESDAAGLEDLPVDNVAPDITDKRLPAVRRWKRVAAV